MTVPMHYAKTDKGGVLTLILKGKSVQIREENHIAFSAIIEALNNGASEDELLALADEKVALKKYVEIKSEGRAQVNDFGKVTLDGQEVHGTIASRIADLMRQKLPFKHLLRFIERVNENPSFSARNELYDFLENKGLPITEDGFFIAYKAVRKDYKDKYSGTIDNSPGNTVSIQRSKVDDDRNHGCSSGLHVGALDYVYNYGSSNCGDIILTVKIDPSDVVSVPSECAYQKCRTCKYEVLRVFDGELTDAVYDKSGQDSLARKNKDNENYHDWSFAQDDHNNYQDDYYNPEDIEVFNHDDDDDDDDNNPYRDVYDDYGYPN